MEYLIIWKKDWAGLYFNYGVVQSYNFWGIRKICRDLDNAAKWLETEQYIFAETFGRQVCKWGVEFGS